MSAASATAFRSHILALIGLGTPGLQERLVGGHSRRFALFYSGLLSIHSRSAVALRQVLIDYFGVPVEIEQFVGAWYPVDRRGAMFAGRSASYSEQLGFGAVVGDEVWDQQSRVRIRLGPLTLDQYQDFLPGGEAFLRIRTLAGFFAGNEFDFEVQLILKRNEVPRCELTAKGPQLGWTTWVKSAEFERDPGDTILIMRKTYFTTGPRRRTERAFHCVPARLNASVVNWEVLLLCR